ncbi:MAG: pilus assembly protein TadG-related protein [Myxococcaceae bacterium]
MKRGQTLALFALLLVFIALGALAAVHTARAIAARIELQDTADAAALSRATLEARAFNAYAYANRTQVSHYANAMVWQSLLSFLFFTEAFLTDLTGFAHTLPCGAPGPLLEPVCTAARALPGVGSVLRVFEVLTAALSQLTVAYQRALHGGVPGVGLADDATDRHIGRGVIPKLWRYNASLAQVSADVMQETATRLAEGLPGDGERNQDDAAQLTACLFARVHDAAALGRPGAPLPTSTPLSPRAREEDSATARAKRTMAQIANAARYGCDGEATCPEAFVTGRSIDSLVRWPSALSGAVASVEKWGQTRLLSHRMGHGRMTSRGINYIRDPDGAPNAPTGMLAQGDNLGADDIYRFPFARVLCPKGTPKEACWGEPAGTPEPWRPFRWLGKTSVWATNAHEPLRREGGVHWRVAFPNNYPAGPGHVPPAELTPRPDLAQMGLHQARRRLLGPVALVVFVANVRAIEDGNHVWPGIAPFPHFQSGDPATRCGLENADKDGVASREDDFQQPSVWISFERASRHRLPLGLDRTNVGRVLSRAQAYYHRPGAWEEPPNFFNPYWRARLAPLLQGRRVPWVTRALADIPRAETDVARWVTH